MAAAMPDPPMKRVGRGRSARYVCVVCGSELGEVAVKNNDPFCKVECARDWHGTTLTKPGRGNYVASTM